MAFDTTLSNDIIEQVESKPKTCVLEARVDIRTLATLLKYFLTKGVRPTNRAQLVRVSLEAYSGLMEKINAVTPFEETEEAMRFLSQQGFHFGKIGNRGNRSLVEQLVKEHVKGDGLAIDMTKPRITKSNTPVGNISMPSYMEGDTPVTPEQLEKTTKQKDQ